MKFVAAIIALCAAGAMATPILEDRTKAVTLSVEYYPKAGCKTGGTTTSVTSGSAHCVNLKEPSLSMKVVGSTKLPNGCTLQAFQGKNCKSFEVDYIDGPSADKCSAPDDNSGKFSSVRVNCS